MAAIITKALLAEGFDSVPVAAPRGIKKWATIRAWRPLLTRAAAIVLIAFGAVYWVERALDLREPRDPTNALRGTILGPGGTPGRTVLTDVGGVQVEVEEDFSNPRVVPDRDGLLWREGQRREMIWFRPVHVPGVDKSKRGPQIRMGMERVERYYRPVGNFYR